MSGEDLVPNNCPHCGASVAQDEQFCPDCGGFIDPLTSPRPGRSGNVIAVGSDGPYEEFRLAEPPAEAEIPPQPAPARRTGTARCPSCGADNPANNRHCQECGARLNQAPLPTAPRPAVQATAGVRAALAISALLFVVIIIALIFNVFNGNGSPTATTLPAATTTSPSVAESGPIEILSSECTPEGIGSFVCDNLTSGTSAEYQITWEELAEGENVVIRLTFRQPMIVERIDWRNIEDPTRFKQNYRARGILIDAQNALQPFPKELEDVPGTQTIRFAAMNANWVQFTIESAWTAEVVDDNVFEELSIDEITIIGRPANG